ncbi:MAG TPA: carbohydrate kinase family protein [Chthoniobacterales bacterium]|nr:carbohydrate kinase family protein [Chthoniobacterales bacterium]
MTNIAPVSVGAGLVSLDRLLIGRDRVNANQRYAGGSCGNVLAILAHLHWQSYPVARLGTDRGARILIEDLKSFQVNTDFVEQENKGITPVIVLRLAQDQKGGYRSRFEWKNPRSGDWLPRYRPLPKAFAERITPRLPNANIFYFDRADASLFMLASRMRQKGTIVFFEPSSCRDDALFTECLSVSDIVKYSAERIPRPPKNPQAISPRLEIQTLGDKGLRYRLKVGTTLPGPWRHLPAFQAESFKDATGCGDWCSAGIIDQLCAKDREDLMQLSEAEVIRGIRFGQALAAINCNYEGARGPMYELSNGVLHSHIQRILASDQHSQHSGTEITNAFAAHA